MIKLVTFFLVALMAFPATSMSDNTKPVRDTCQNRSKVINTKAIDSVLKPKVFNISDVKYVSLLLINKDKKKSEK